MSDVISRFDYQANRRAAGTYARRRSPFWPPLDRYVIATLDLSRDEPNLEHGFDERIGALRDVIEEEWLRARTEEGGTGFADPSAVASALRSLVEFLPAEGDRQALTLRADAVEDGYRAEALEALSALSEDVTFVAARISTWYGKHLRRMPTAFGCQLDPQHQRLVREAMASEEDARHYLQSLHADLQLSEVPAFAPSRLFFMAGEGNLHPKHIAYFLPSDEGVRHSPFKKTYYFVNTHEKLLREQSMKLGGRYLEVGPAFDLDDPEQAAIPTLGVFAHEVGHSVMRPSSSYKGLNELDRWASVVLQEVAADVFGALLLAEAWETQFGYSREAAISYYLSECVRYANRGLGHFPDSDGMYLQLSYLTNLGALRLVQDEGTKLVGDPAVVIAGLRSLARVLADTLLGGTAEAASDVYATFGPGSSKGDVLSPLIDELRGEAAESIEYSQEHLTMQRSAAAEVG
ncbi:MAG TPA: hypothetical protein VMS60_02480 [Solirubrobacterales bacterium]|nr:hypothetical protein [Solirubrobacterales bacterium]